MTPKKEFNYTVERHIATIASAGALTTELNVIRYGDSDEAKYDLRRWRVVDGQKQMMKGLTMSRDELWLLRDALAALEELS